MTLRFKWYSTYYACLLCLFFGGLCYTFSHVSTPKTLCAAEISDDVEEIDLGDLELDDLELDDLELLESSDSSDDVNVSENAEKKVEPKKVATPEKKDAPISPKTEKAYYPLESVIPADSALILRIVSVRKFNERLEKMTETNVLKLLKTLGKGEYAKQIEPDRPVGVALFPIQNTFQWVAAIPVKNYRKFAVLLGVSTEKLPETVPDGTVSVISDTLCIAPYHGHAVLAAGPMFLGRILRGEKFSTRGRYTPCAVKDPTVSVEITNAMIQFLVRRGRIGLEEFAPVFSPEMLPLQENSEQMRLVQKYFEQVNNSIAWLNANIFSARIDISIGQDSTIVSSAFLPRPQTRLAELLNDLYVPMINTSLNSEDFLKVVPIYPASVCGQVDIPPASAETFPAPYNRIRHVEYSLITPPENGRLAETWCFFLEVNDAHAFVKEMIVPQAEDVGGQFGANTLAEIGGDLAQQNAERRLERQLNRRRPPRRYVDPEKAASRGEVIGGFIGGLIGKAVAKKEALKVQDYMGHDLYVSDLVQFTQLKKRIREQQQGTAPPASQALGGKTPSQMIGALIQGLLSGDMNIQVGDRLGGGLLNGLNQEDPRDPPLAATRNFILVLDAQHILIVPGNETVLYYAVMRWHAIRDQYLPPEPPLTPEQQAARMNIPQYVPQYETQLPEPPALEDASWHTSWNDICNTIATPSRHQLRFASIFSPEETMNTVEFASNMYGFEIPKKVQTEFPRDLPPFLGVYTTAGNTGNTFTTIPHDMSRTQFQKLVTNLPLLLMKQSVK